MWLCTMLNRRTRAAVPSEALRALSTITMPRNLREHPVIALWVTIQGTSQAQTHPWRGHLRTRAQRRDLTCKGPWIRIALGAMVTSGQRKALWTGRPGRKSTYYASMNLTSNHWRLKEGGTSPSLGIIKSYSASDSTAPIWVNQGLRADGHWAHGTSKWTRYTPRRWIRPWPIPTRALRKNSSATSEPQKDLREPWRRDPSTRKATGSNWKSYLE